MGGKGVAFQSGAIKSVQPTCSSGQQRIAAMQRSDPKKLLTFRSSVSREMTSHAPTLVAWLPCL